MPTDLCLAHLVRRDWLTDGPLNELLALYIQALQNRRYARSTLSAYLRGLAHFSYWMRGEGLSVAEIDRALIERFLLHHLHDVCLPSALPIRCEGDAGGAPSFAGSAPPSGWGGDDVGLHCSRA